MQDSLSRLRELWQNTSRVNQMLVIGLAVAAILAGIIFLYIAGTPEYQPLVTGVSDADASKIVSMLRDKKVPYRLGSSNSIEVPASQVDELRMTAAAAGLLESGSMGYALLDKVPLGQTQEMEQQTIRRALEGEMEKAIQSLDPVASASVKYAEGEDSLFINPDQKEPSASILVHLKPGREMSKANVRAIVSLVKCAFTGLSEKHITVIDGDSNPLWDGAQADGGLGAEDRQTQERAFNEAKAREIKQLLAAVVPPHLCSVIVHGELNLDRQTEAKREVTAGPKIERTTEEETLTGTGTVGGSRPTPTGLASNAGGAATPPTYAGASVNDGSGKYTHSTSTEKSATTETTTQTTKAPGEIKTLSVGVLLDKSVSPETVTAVRDIIQNAIGADPSDPLAARRVRVQSVTFNRESQTKAQQEAQNAARNEMINRWLGFGVPILLMAVMLFILSRALRRTPAAEMPLLAGGARPALAAAGAGGNGLDMVIGDTLPAGTRVGDALEGGANPAGTEDDEHQFEVISEAFDANLESILHLARSKPETVAQLIRSWMREDEH